MPYITVKQTPGLYQMTFDDILDGKTISFSQMSAAPKVTGTRTYYKWYLDWNFFRKFDFNSMIVALEQFNEQTKEIASKERVTLYDNFYREKRGKGMPYIFKQIFASQKTHIDCDSKEICKEVAKSLRGIISNHPAEKDDGIKNRAFKKCADFLVSKGFTITKDEIADMFKSAYRKIDNPDYELQCYLEQLKEIFETKMFALYHTSAFAYVKGRSTIDSIKKHQQNESRWFAKFDFSNFFGSVTQDFLMSMLSQIFPFSEIIKRDVGKIALNTALNLCFLNGGLPQGTRISPMLTNLMMIPIDHELSNTLRNKDENFVYTRYADDILISSRIKFDCKELQNYIISVLEKHKAPFSINTEKTRLGSSAGRNYNLGVILNKDNNITVGHQKKKEFKAALCNYITDKKNGHSWDLHEVQILDGTMSYYRMVEKDYIDYVVDHYNKKFSVDVLAMIRQDLRQ